MRTIMEQVIPPVDPGAGGEVLLPSCGAAVVTVTEVIITPTCVDVVVDDPTPAPNTLVTATGTLRRGNGTPLVGQVLHWRVMKGVQISTEGQGTTDSNGEITFSFTVGTVGIYEFIASFFGNPEPPGRTDAQKWIGCARSLCVGSGPGPGPGFGQVLSAPFCGIGCGQDVCETDGLEPTD